MWKRNIDQFEEEIQRTSLPIWFGFKTTWALVGQIFRQPKHYFSISENISIFSNILLLNCTMSPEQHFSFKRMTLTEYTELEDISDTEFSLYRGHNFSLGLGRCSNYPSLWASNIIFKFAKNYFFGVGSQAVLMQRKGEVMIELSPKCNSKYMWDLGLWVKNVEVEWSCLCDSYRVQFSATRFTFLFLNLPFTMWSEHIRIIKSKIVEQKQEIQSQSLHILSGL